MSRRVVALAAAVAAVGVLWGTRTEAPLRVGDGGAAAARGAAGPGVLVLDLRDDLDDEAVAAWAAERGWSLALSDPSSRDEALYRVEVADVAAAAASVAGDERVEVAEPVVEVHALGYPDDPRFGEQWNLSQIGAAAGWRVGAGRGVRVAVLDTGVSAVEDLGGVVLATGRSFVPGVDGAADDHGHGTHVAGTIAQATDNGLGVAGIAPRVTVVPYKVLAAQGGGSSDRIAAAIDHAADAGVDVINLSLGGPPSAVLTKAANAAAARGVLVVAAAGNTGGRGLGSPADGHRVIAVGATGPDGTKAPYSTFGEGVELAAPGGDTSKAGGGILQDTVEGDGHAYKAWQGTSMATPHVSGALAVLLGMGVAPDAAVDVLMRTAVDVGGDGFDEVYGHGRIDLEAAVGRVVWSGAAPRALAGALVVVALGVLCGFGVGRMAGMGLVAAWAAGGAFWVWLLPVGAGGEWAWLGLDPMRWPGAWMGPGWTHNGFVAAAWLPLGVTFLLGLSRRWAPWVAAWAAGVGVALLSGALDGTLAPLGGGWVSEAWLGGHALVCLAAALAASLAVAKEYAG